MGEHQDAAEKLAGDLIGLKRLDRPAYDAIFLLLVRMVERKSRNGRAR